MAVSKLQSIIQKLSESENVKKVVNDIQKLSTDVQNKVQTINKNDAVKKYKEIVKKVSQAEKDLQSEVNKVVVKIKSSATDVEKNLGLYRKKAIQQKNKIEKMLKAKKAAPAPKAKRAKSAPKRTAKKAAKKK